MRTIKEILIKGMIVKDSAKESYNNLKMETTTPKDVIDNLSGKEPIKLIINSVGGDVMAGSEIYTALKKYEGDIQTEIIFAASIATVIAMASDKISMSPTGQFMIHNVSTSTEGDYRDMEKSAQTLRNMNTMIASSYKSRLKISDDELKAMMDNETWLNAEQAKNIGLIDEIMFENKVKSYVACFNNNLSFEGGEIVEDNKSEVVYKKDFDAFAEEIRALLKEVKFENADDDSDEARLVRRIDQLEKLKEDGNALSDSERVELIDDLLELVRDNRRTTQQQKSTTSNTDPDNADDDTSLYENKNKKLGLFL